MIHYCAGSVVVLAQAAELCMLPPIPESTGPRPLRQVLECVDDAAVSSAVGAWQQRLPQCPSHPQGPAAAICQRRQQRRWGGVATSVVTNWAFCCTRYPALITRRQPYWIRASVASKLLIIALQCAGNCSDGRPHEHSAS